MNDHGGLLTRIREELDAVHVHLKNLSSCCGEEDGKCVTVIAVLKGDCEDRQAGDEPGTPEKAAT